jgi:hypothetical protein
MTTRDWVNVGIISLLALAMGTTFPDLRGEVIALWTLLVMAYALVLLGDRIGSLVLRSRFDRALVPPKKTTSRPEDLQRCEHSFGWRSYSPRDFDHELRPQLTALIAQGSKQIVIEDELPALDRSGDYDSDSRPSIRTQDLTRLIDKIEHP